MNIQGQISNIVSELSDLRDAYFDATEIHPDPAREEVLADRIADLEAQLTAFYDFIEGRYEDESYLSYLDYPAECPVQVPDSDYVHPAERVSK